MSIAFDERGDTAGRERRRLPRSVPEDFSYTAGTLARHQPGPHARIRQQTAVNRRHHRVFHRGARVEDDGARDLVDLRSRRGKHDAESLLLLTGWLDRDGGAKSNPVALPLVDLRLVDEQRGAGETDVARPRVRRHCGR